MTRLEVISDAIKIGVPSLLTGATAFLIARGSRKHELEKERRRRKQDFLLRFTEAFDVLRIACENGASFREAVENFKKENAQEKELKAREELLKQTEFIDSAHNSFEGLETQLQLFGFSACVPAFRKYNLTTMEFKRSVISSSLDHKELMKEWWSAEDELRQSVVREFAEL